MLALKVGLAGGWAVALAAALLLAVVNDTLHTSPFDLVALFLHLLPLACLALALGFTVLAGVLIVALRLLPARRIERLSLGLAVLTTGLVVVLVLRGLVAAPAEVTGWQLALLLVVPPPLLYVCIEVLYSGLLSLAIKLADRPPRRRTLAGSWIGAAVLLGLGLLVLPAALAMRNTTPEPPRVLPSTPGQPVLVIGLDGVLPAELDYLLARGELPALKGLLDAGAVLGDYRWPRQPPAGFWPVC